MDDIGGAFNDNDAASASAADDDDDDDGRSLPWLVHSLEDHQLLSAL